MTDTIQNMPTVSISATTDLIKLAASIKRSLILWGEPGVGKSAIVKAFAKKINGHLVDIRLSQYDAVDMRGLPDDGGDGTTMWLRPATMPFKGNKEFEALDGPIVLFLDEIMQAKADLQAMSFQLLHTDDRSVGEHKLLDNVIVVGASNRETDRAGVQKMLSPVANRCIHVNVETSLDAWKAWALGAGVDPMIVGYLNFKPEHLSQFEQALKTSAKCFPTPRAWETVSDVLAATENSAVLRDLAIAATVGEGVATEFNAFVRMAEKAPTFEQIADNPEGTPVPEARDMMCAVLAMICRRADGSNVDQILPYLRRMPIEYQSVFCADVGHSNPALIIESDGLMQLMADVGADVFESS